MSSRSSVRVVVISHASTTGRPLSEVFRVAEPGRKRSIVLDAVTAPIMRFASNCHQAPTCSSTICARRGGASQIRLRRACRAISETFIWCGISRLWPRRSAPRPQGVRHARPGRGWNHRYDRYWKMHRAKLASRSPTSVAACTRTRLILPRCSIAQNTNRGERIDISMFECMAEWMMPPLNVCGRAREKSPRKCRSAAQHGRAVRGVPLCGWRRIACCADRSRWRRLCATRLDSPAVADDPRFCHATNCASCPRVARIVDRRTFLPAHACLDDRIARGSRRHSHRRDERYRWRCDSNPARGRWVNVGSPTGEFSALYRRTTSGAPRRAWERSLRWASTPPALRN